MCEKSFKEIAELAHHIHLEHSGIDSKKLKLATESRNANNSEFESIGKKGEGTNFICPDCFELFSSMDRLADHRKHIHKMQLTEDAQRKLKEMPKSGDKITPQCEKCKLYFVGLVICKIDNITLAACLSCYENHYGVNALRKLTIGTPDDTLDKMRKPIIEKND